MFSYSTYTVTSINSTLQVFNSTSPSVPFLSATDSAFATGTIAPTWGDAGNGGWGSMVVTFNTQPLLVNTPIRFQGLWPGQWSHYKINLTAAYGSNLWDAVNVQTVLHTAGQCCLNIYTALNTPPHDYAYDYASLSTDFFTSVVYPQPGLNTLYVGVFNAQNDQKANFTITVVPVWATPIDAGQVLPAESLVGRLQQNLYALTPSTSWSKLTMVVQPTAGTILSRDVLRVLFKQDDVAVDGQWDSTEVQGGSDGSGSYAFVISNVSPATTFWWNVRITNQNYTLANYTITVLPPDALLLTSDLSISPTVGGATCTLTGMDLSTPGVLQVNSRTAVVLSWTYNQIVFLTPMGEGIGVPINLTTALGQRSNKLQIAYMTPSLDSISPNNAPTIGGTSVFHKQPQQRVPATHFVLLCAHPCFFLCLSLLLSVSSRSTVRISV